jgi:hypothetical protein
MDKTLKRKGLHPGMLSNMLVVVDKSLSGLPLHYTICKDECRTWVFAIHSEYKAPGLIESLVSKVEH